MVLSDEIPTKEEIKRFLDRFKEIEDEEGMLFRNRMYMDPELHSLSIDKREAIIKKLLRETILYEPRIGYLASKYHSVSNADIVEAIADSVKEAIIAKTVESFDPTNNLPFNPNNLVWMIVDDTIIKDYADKGNLELWFTERSTNPDYMGLIEYLQEHGFSVVIGNYLYSIPKNYLKKGVCRRIVGKISKIPPLLPPPKAKEMFNEEERFLSDIARGKIPLEEVIPP